MTLSGSDLVTLFEQQGYVFNEKRSYWENSANENRFEISFVKDPKNSISLAYDEHTAAAKLESDEYLKATGSGGVDEMYN